MENYFKIILVTPCVMELHVLSCADHFGSDGSRGYEMGDILCTLVVNGPTFRGSNCAIFIFVSPFQWGSTFKGKNLLL